MRDIIGDESQDSSELMSSSKGKIFNYYAKKLFLKALRNSRIAISEDII